VQFVQTKKGRSTLGSAQNLIPKEHGTEAQMH